MFPIQSALLFVLYNLTASAQLQRNEALVVNWYKYNWKVTVQSECAQATTTKLQNCNFNNEF